MQSANSSAITTDPSYNHPSSVQQSATNGASRGQASDGESSLTPRQEPQGEESRMQESTSPNQNSSQFLRQQSCEKAASVRHKVQSNSVPVQCSHRAHHNVKPTQSRSLDSSNVHTDNGAFYGVSAPQYRSPPLYGAAVAVSAKVDKLPSNAAVVHNGKSHNSSSMNHPFLQTDDSLLPPPPEYPGNRADVRRSYEVLDRMPAAPYSGLSQSSSQPELTHLTHAPTSSQVVSANGAPVYAPNSYSEQKQTTADQQQDFAAIAARASKMVEILSEENKGLRNELEAYYRKVSKLQKFELELQKVREAHDTLVKSSVKKESIEKAIRARQEMDIKQLEEAGRKSQEKVLLLEKKLTDQNALVIDMKNIIVQHEEAIAQLTKLTTEQRETISSSGNAIQDLTNELHDERSQSKLYSEELEAYKSNASITMEEESEVKMAALTQSTKDAERIIQEAQTEKLRYMDEAHQACKRVALLEAKLKALEASCAEKDAVVRVLQRRQRSNLSGRGTTCTSPIPAPHARRISEPSSPAGTTGSAHSNSEDPLQTQTWQV